MADPGLGKDLDDYLAKRRPAERGFLNGLFKKRQESLPRQEKQESLPKPAPQQAQPVVKEKFEFEDEKPNFFAALHDKIRNFFRKSD